MSGGSYEYRYLQIDQLADDIKAEDGESERLAFKQFLKDIANVCHDIEWVDSGDYGEGREVESIKSVLTHTHDNSPTILVSISC